MIGQTIAHYSITAKLGQGGMGEVYQATDTKLRREVALKILPGSFTDDPQRMARFTREAQVLASLSHPNIGGIYGIEEQDGVRALVLELIGGEDLSEIIAGGPIPLEDALRIALQIAEALEAAHERGIIHRDLKPANIKITSEGQVKVLDFGLAKALNEERPPGDISDSPTLTMQATRAGMILGTAAYMSPEQAKGKSADHRADIWSFGVVLFEMLSGQKAFAGDDITEIMASVVKADVEWAQLAPKAPSKVKKVLQRCLQADPRQRYQAIGDIRLDIHDYLNDPSAGEGTGDRGSAATQPGWQRSWPVIAGLLTVALATSLWRPWQQPPLPQQPTRMTLQIPAELRRGYGAAVVLSPDERLIVYATSEPALHLRRMGELEAVRLSGTEAAQSPFFSPDGQWIAFAAGSELKKVSIHGGAPLTLCEVRGGFRGGTWGEDGTLVFTTGPGSPLSRISHAGGVPDAITTLAEGEHSHRWPDFLPGAKAVLMTVHSGGSFEDARIEAVTLADGRRKVLHHGGYYARYAPSGHLLFLREGTLFAAPFDPKHLELLGPPTPVLEGVMANALRGNGEFAFSRQGSLIYQTGAVAELSRSLVWVDREGSITTSNTEAAGYRDLRFSPDGKRLAMTISDGNPPDIWIQDLVRGTRSRLTFDDASDYFPVWTPDGKEILFSSTRDGAPNIYRKRADGTGEVKRLTEIENAQYPTSISADGRYLVGGGNPDLWTLALEEEGAKPEPLLETEFSETQPSFSPDGRWIAYSSNESGRFEVYARPFPRGPGKWQISTQGGGFPIWSRTGNELLYWWQDSMYSVSYQTEAETFRAQPPERLFSGTFQGIEFDRGFDLAPDGERFVMLQSAEDAESDPSRVVLVQNWFEELKRLVPTDN